MVYKVLRIQPFLTGFAVCHPSSPPKEACESIIFLVSGTGWASCSPIKAMSAIRILQHFGRRTHHLICHDLLWGIGLSGLLSGSIIWGFFSHIIFRIQLGFVMQSALWLLPAFRFAASLWCYGILLCPKTSLCYIASLSVCTNEYWYRCIAVSCINTQYICLHLALIHW